MRRILIFAICVAMLLSSVGCRKENVQEEGAKEKGYESILELYAQCLSQKAALQELPFAEGEIGQAVRAAVEKGEDPAAMGYATKDLNEDGVPELVLLDRSNRLYALFTIREGAPVLLLQMNRNASAITPDGTVYSQIYVKDQSDITHVKRIVNGRLEGLEFGTVITNGQAEYYRIENGARQEITAEEKGALSESVRRVFMSCAYVNKTAGFRFLSVLGGREETLAPVFDASSYDTILAAYRRIVESFKDYTQAKWTAGEFDSLFSFSNDEDYRVFHGIFYGGIRVMPTKTPFGSEYAENGNRAYGYAKKDLNGDGVEELILLNDNYRVIALFTQVNGAPILLKAAFDAWIDETGKLRFERSTGGVLSRDGEAFLYEVGNGDLRCLLGVGYQVGWTLQKSAWYRIENGARVPISGSEGEALYAQYDVLPHGWTEQEYTKSRAGIVFIPLFEPACPEKEHLNTFTNGAIVNGESIEISSVSEESLSFTLALVQRAESRDPDFEPQRMTVSAEATEADGVYVFHAEGLRGSITLCVGSLWVVIEESATNWVECRAYLFDRPAIY
ncbi:MAG: hypothetical protein E7620_02680 [Ruminococcaceae bacterium]|nr:hypothetical protein [Oscillospiraceae bacterium]